MLDQAAKLRASGCILSSRLVPRRDHENQQIPATAIILFNCRYLGRVLGEMRSRGQLVDEALVLQLSPLGWDHINLTSDYVWSDATALIIMNSCRFDHPRHDSSMSLPYISVS